MTGLDVLEDKFPPLEDRHFDLEKVAAEYCDREETLHMPFPAVPIFFYNRLDGRGPIAIREGFDEHFEVMRWWAQ